MIGPKTIGNRFLHWSYRKPRFPGTPFRLLSGSQELSAIPSAASMNNDSPARETQTDSCYNSMQFPRGTPFQNRYENPCTLIVWSFGPSNC